MNQRIPPGGASGFAYQQAHAMHGELNQPAGSPNTNYKPGPETDDRWKDWTQIPAFYTVTVFLDTIIANATGAGSVPIRPEPFVLKRITFAAIEDVLSTGVVFSSTAGRCVEIAWEDEFTKFLGNQPCMVSALFGDSQGFLDLSAGILFQGRQTLQVNLRRIIPNPVILGQPEPVNTMSRWDFNFQGIALLPPGVQSSGSAR